MICCIWTLLHRVTSIQMTSNWIILDTWRGIQRKSKGFLSHFLRHPVQYLLNIPPVRESKKKSWNGCGKHFSRARTCHGLIFPRERPRCPFINRKKWKTFSFVSFMNGKTWGTSARGRFMSAEKNLFSLRNSMPKRVWTIVAIWRFVEIRFISSLAFSMFPLIEAQIESLSFNTRSYIKYAKYVMSSWFQRLTAGLINYQKIFADAEGPSKYYVTSAEHIFHQATTSTEALVKQNDKSCVIYHDSVVKRWNLGRNETFRKKKQKSKSWE